MSATEPHTADAAPSPHDEAAAHLAKWDAGESVWSVEMGGLGPGYEQAIQVTAFEVLRYLVETQPDLASFTEGDDARARWDAFREARDKAVNPRIDHLGVSGSQHGAACNLANILYGRGPTDALADPVVADRKIQVRKNFPQADAAQ